MKRRRGWSVESKGLQCEEEWWDGENEGGGWEAYLYPTDSTNNVTPYTLKHHHTINNRHPLSKAQHHHCAVLLFSTAPFVRSPSMRSLIVPSHTPNTE